MRSADSFRICSLSLLCLFFFKALAAQEIDQRQLRGTWYLAMPHGNHPSIAFYGKDDVILTSRGDTIYRFKYRLSTDTLYLTDVFKRTVVDKILKLRNDSLLFKALQEDKSDLLYLRK